jgi:glycosyltransferase involved in cell wall biosynthesis
MSCRLARRGPTPEATTRLTTSVITPTKNRSVLLAEAMRALLTQTVLPDELIVVDQSDDDRGRQQVAALVAAVPAARRPRLVYLLDRSINGAAAARNVGLDRATGDIVICHDDDVVAEPSAIERLLNHYCTAPDLAGVAPVITNYAAPSPLRRLFHRVFERGPFRDERQPVYWFWRRHPGPTRIPVRMFTGAMMSFRRAALDGIRYDARYRGASVGGDIDLCWTLGRRGGRLAIVTDARIIHTRAPRSAARSEEARIAAWGFLYRKHLPMTLATRAAFAWYVTGVFVSATVYTLVLRTPAPLRSAWAGLRARRTDFAGSSFLSASSAPARARVAR